MGNARSLAKMYAAIIGEVDDRPPLLKPDTIAEFAKVHSSGIDKVTGTDVHTFGLGFEVQGIRYPFLGPDAFGHSGAAGAQAFADPRSGVTYGYARRRFPYPPEGGRWRTTASPLPSSAAPQPPDAVRTRRPPAERTQASAPPPGQQADSRR